MTKPTSKISPRAATLASLVVATLAVCGCSTSTIAPIVFPPLKSLELATHADTLRVGESLAFSVIAKDSSDNVVNGVPVQWMSGNTSIFTVNSSGRVRGMSEGAAWLFAANGTLRDSAWVTIEPAQDGWYVQYTSSGLENLNGVFFQSDGRNGCVVGNNGRIWTTDDAGSSWRSRVSGTAFALHAVWFTSASDGWAVGAAGTVLMTDDGGVTWARIDVQSGENLYDVCFATPDSGWAVGAGGLTLRTTDGGQTWQRRFAGGNTLRSVSFAGSHDGWAVGDIGTIVGTHDGGATWFIVQPAVTTQPLKSVWRRSESMAVAAGAQGVTPRTIAGVDSTMWQLATAGAANALEAVHFPTDMIGFAAGYNGGGAILRSDDGGQTWQAQVANTPWRIKDVFFVDALHGWAVAENGVILHTGSGGEL